MNIDKISNTLELFRIPNPFRDIVILLTGLIGLLFIYLNSEILKFGLDSNFQHYLEKFSNLGRLEAALIFLAAAYSFGRLLGPIGNLLMRVLGVALRILAKAVITGSDFKHLHKKISIAGIKSYLVNFIDPSVNYIQVTPDDVKREVSSVEISEVHLNNPSIAAEIERTIFQTIFLKNLCAMAFLSAIFIHNRYYLACLVLGVFAQMEISSLKQREYAAYKMVVKSRGK